MPKLVPSGWHRVYLPALVFVLMGGAGCKRYAEDDRRYLKSACTRVAGRWELTGITDKNGRDFQDSVFFYQTPDNNWKVSPDQSYTYRGLVLELDRSDNRWCLETGIIGEARVVNKPFGTGYYSLVHKRKYLRFDLAPVNNANRRYFFDLYTIQALSDDALVFSNSNVKASFRRLR